MKLTKYFFTISLMCGMLLAGDLPAKAKLTPCTKSTSDEIMLTHGHPHLGGSRSPGDSVGMTGLEYQANGGCEKRVYIDDSLHTHILWMKVPFPYSSMAQRRIEYNMRYADGSWFGEVDATPYTSGYGSLDMTRIPPQKLVIAFNYNGPCIIKNVRYFGTIGRNNRSRTKRNGKSFSKSQFKRFAGRHIFYYPKRGVYNPDRKTDKSALIYQNILTKLNG